FRLKPLALTVLAFLMAGLTRLAGTIPAFEAGAAPPRATPSAEPAVQAVDFESRKVYQSMQRPSYTSWVSFFPGENGQWYITCEEVTRPDRPLPRSSRQQWFEMSLPNGYDKSSYQMEMVMLE